MSAGSKGGIQGPTVVWVPRGSLTTPFHNWENQNFVKIKCEKRRPLGRPPTPAPVPSLGPQPPPPIVPCPQP